MNRKKYEEIQEEIENYGFTITAKDFQRNVYNFIYSKKG